MENLKEAIKEPGRLVLLAVVSWLLTEGSSLIVNRLGGQLSSETKMIVTGLLISTLRGVDAYLHELGKEMGNENLTKGLTRF